MRSRGARLFGLIIVSAALAGCPITCEAINEYCANTGNCSQADGPAVCCLQNSTCVLDGQCASSPNYVPCSATNPCTKGGWVCCTAGGNFKPSEKKMIVFLPGRFCIGLMTASRALMVANPC